MSPTPACSRAHAWPQPLTSSLLWPRPSLTPAQASSPRAAAAGPGTLGGLGWACRLGSQQGMQARSLLLRDTGLLCCHEVARNSHPPLRVSASGSPPPQAFVSPGPGSPLCPPCFHDRPESFQHGPGARDRPAQGARQRPAHLKLGRMLGGRAWGCGPGAAP